MAAEGMTPRRTGDAKTYLTGAYPLRFDGNGQIADILVGMQMEGLPIDYAATRNAKIEAVTLEDVKRVAARLLQPGDAAFRRGRAARGRGSATSGRLNARLRPWPNLGASLLEMVA